jgi:hypothetical protein
MEQAYEQQGDIRHFSKAISHTAGCQFKTNHRRQKQFLKFHTYTLLLLVNSLHESICILIICPSSFYQCFPIFREMLIKKRCTEWIYSIEANRRICCKAITITSIESKQDKKLKQCHS